MISRRLVELSESESRVIAECQHRADFVLKELATLCGLPEYTVRRTLEGLRKRGILLTRCHFLDLYRVGMIGGSIYLSVAERALKDEASFLEPLKQAPQITYIAKIEGSFNYLIAFMAESIRPVQRIFRELSVSNGGVFQQRALTMNTTFSAFSRKHLAPERGELPAFHLDSDVEPITIDDVDRAVLRAVSEHEFQTNREIARRIGMQHTLVERRLKRLRDAGVVRGAFYRFNSAAMGLTLYRVLINLRDLRAEVFRSVHDFAARQPHVLRCIETVGPWDFELDIEVADSAGLTEVINDLDRVAGPAVRATQSMRIAEHCHYRSFPFPVSRPAPAAARKPA